MSTRERIEQVLRAALAPQVLTVEDQSHLHAGHPGAAGRAHIAVTVVAGGFEGKSRLERHRMVHAALAEELRSTIHALALTTLTPAEWQREHP